MNNSLLIGGGILALILIVGIASALLNNRANAEQTTNYPYQRRNYLLSKAERSFYEVLTRAAGDEVLVFPKVGLSDIIYIERGAESRLTHWNRIQSKHVDFVLCRLPTISPALVIELDDSSHDRPDRQDRDAFVDTALQSAGLAILRIKARDSYNERQLASQINALLATPASMREAARNG